MKKTSIIGIAVLVLLIGVQLIRPSKINPPVQTEQDFLSIAQPPAEVAAILTSACYDCHSHTTKYPWYTHVAPVSWWINHHIEDGRKHLNFSVWSNYSAQKADHKLEEIIETVRNKEMPMVAYTWAHAAARLSPEQRALLADWTASYRLNMQR
jgi:hypothetical protein